MKNKIFEYMIINDQEDGNPNSKYDLNNLGKYGWELCGIVQQIDGSVKWYFKREK